MKPSSISVALCLLFLFISSAIAQNLADENQSKRLVIAVGQGDSETVTSLIADGVDVNEVYLFEGSEHETPLLLHAIMEEQRDMVKLLIDAGADVKRLDRKISLLALPMRNKDPVMVKLLLDTGASTKPLTKLPESYARHGELLDDSEFALLFALVVKDDDLFEKTFRKIVETKDEKLYFKAFSFASVLGDSKTLKMILDRDIIPPKSATRLFFNAAMTGNDQIIQMLLDAGIDVNEKDETGNTPLYMITVGMPFINYSVSSYFTPKSSASSDYAQRLMKRLLAEGADPNAKSKYGLSLISKSIMSVNPRAIEILARGGANIGVIDDESGTTALHYAIAVQKQRLLGKRPHMKSNFYVPDDDGMVVIKKLIELGADVNALTKKGETPLHAAIECDRHVVSLLIEAGAKVNLGDNAGRAPLHWLVRSIYPEKDDLVMMRVLIEAGAKVNLADNDGQTPLHMAANMSNRSMTAYFDPPTEVLTGDIPLNPLINRPVAEYRLDEDVLTMIRVLLKAGADPLAKNVAGQTAVDLATDEKVIKLLTTD